MSLASFRVERAERGGMTVNALGDTHASCKMPEPVTVALLLAPPHTSSNLCRGLPPYFLLALRSSPRTLPFPNKMHLGFIDLIRGFFGSRTANGNAFDSGKIDRYYVRGSIRDRGPCPALNALANQGYL